MKGSVTKTFDWLFWTFDPRAADKALEFILYDFQDVGVNIFDTAITECEDVLAEKSRDMGVTWMALCVALRRWLFEPDFQALCASRKEEFVDKRGDKKSLFERMRWELRQIEGAMPGIVPKDWHKNIYSGERKLIHPETGATISGEATTADLSRAGRYNLLILDEFAIVDDQLQEQIWTSTGDTAPCRFLISSPFGSTNLFARLALGLRQNKESVVKV